MTKNMITAIQRLNYRQVEKDEKMGFEKTSKNGSKNETKNFMY